MFANDSPSANSAIAGEWRAYHESILRPPSERKFAKSSANVARAKRNAGCSRPFAFAIAMSLLACCAAFAKSLAKCKGKNGVSHGAERIHSVFAARIPAWIPASGPQNPPISSGATWASFAYSAMLRFALMICAPVCGDNRDNVRAAIGMSASKISPLSSPPIRRASPPASKTPVMFSECIVARTNQRLKNN